MAKDKTDTKLMETNTYTVKFDIKKVYEEVHVQSWYRGEALKADKPEIALVQSSSDDETQMRGVLESAVNDVALRLTKRLRDVTWEIGTDNDDDNTNGTGTSSTEEQVKITFTPFGRVPEGDADKVSLIMGKAIYDYVVNDCLASWFSVALPDASVAAIYEGKREGLMDRVMDACAMLAEHPVRRRATNLCGI